MKNDTRGELGATIPSTGTTADGSKGLSEATESDDIWTRTQRKVADFEREVGVGLYHRGYRFYPPYACGRCGEPISAYQFAFGRACGACDIGDSRARLGFGDKRWFLSGKAVLEDANDQWLIHPEFIPAGERHKYAPVRRPKLKPIIPPFQGPR